MVRKLVLYISIWRLKVVWEWRWLGQLGLGRRLLRYEKEPNQSKCIQICWKAMLCNLTTERYDMIRYDMISYDWSQGLPGWSAPDSAELRSQRVGLKLLRVIMGQGQSVCCQACEDDRRCLFVLSTYGCYMGTVSDADNPREVVAFLYRSVLSCLNRRCA